MVSANYDIKFVDFGAAAALEGEDGDGLHLTRLGSPSYMAPEVHLQLHYQA